MDSPHEVARLSYLQASEGQGDTLLPEVLQELPESHDHGVVYAADVRALQDCASWNGCWGDGSRVCHSAGRTWLCSHGRGEARPSRDRSPGLWLSKRARVEEMAIFLGFLECQFLRQRHRRKRGPY